MLSIKSQNHLFLNVSSALRFFNCLYFFSKLHKSNIKPDIYSALMYVSKSAADRVESKKNKTSLKISAAVCTFWIMQEVALRKNIL